MDRFQEQYGSYPAQVVDAQADQMICPENKRLRFQYFDHQPGRTIRVYIARKEECHVCPSRQACCGQSELKQTGRKITVSEDQVPIRTFDARMNTAHAKRIYRQTGTSGRVSSRLDQKQMRTAAVQMPHDIEGSL